MHKNKLLRKGLVIAIIILFIGMSVFPSTGTIVLKKSIMPTISSNMLYVETSENSKSLEINKEDVYQPCWVLVSKHYPTSDTYASHLHPDENYGFFENIRITNEYGINGSSGWADVAYIRFPIEWFGPNTKIAFAELKLYYYNYENTNPVERDLNIYRVTSYWNEETLTWNNQPTYEPEPISSATVLSSVGDWITWDVTSDVQSYMDDIPPDFHYGYRISDDNFWGKPNIPTTMVRSRDNVSFIPCLWIGINVTVPRDTGRGLGTLPLPLPRNKAIYNSLLLKLLEQFPLLERLLSLIRVI